MQLDVITFPMDQHDQRQKPIVINMVIALQVRTLYWKVIGSNTAFSRVISQWRP